MMELPVATRTEKQAVSDLLKELPANASLEEIQYSIYVREVLQQRLGSLPKAKLVSQHEVERRMAKWLGK
jgi:hypothetical protein